MNQNTFNEMSFEEFIPNIGIEKLPENQNIFIGMQIRMAKKNFAKFKNDINKLCDLGAYRVKDIKHPNTNATTFYEHLEYNKGIFKFEPTDKPILSLDRKNETEEVINSINMRTELLILQIFAIMNTYNFIITQKTSK